MKQVLRDQRKTGECVSWKPREERVPKICEKKGSICNVAKRWMNFKYTSLSERNQKAIYCLISLWHSCKDKTTGIENRLVYYGLNMRVSLLQSSTGDFGEW